MMDTKEIVDTLKNIALNLRANEKSFCAATNELYELMDNTSDRIRYEIQMLPILLATPRMIHPTTGIHAGDYHLAMATFKPRVISAIRRIKDLSKPDMTHSRYKYIISQLYKVLDIYAKSDDDRKKSIEIVARLGDIINNNNYNAMESLEDKLIFSMGSNNKTLLSDIELYIKSIIDNLTSELKSKYIYFDKAVSISTERLDGTVYCKLRIYRKDGGLILTRATLEDKDNRYIDNVIIDRVFGNKRYLLEAFYMTEREMEKIGEYVDMQNKAAKLDSLM